jgi:hypothetical protein
MCKAVITTPTQHGQPRTPTVGMAGTDPPADFQRAHSAYLFARATRWLTPRRPTRTRPRNLGDVTALSWHTPPAGGPARGDRGPCRRHRRFRRQLQASDLPRRVALAEHRARPPRRSPPAADLCPRAARRLLRPRRAPSRYSLPTSCPRCASCAARPRSFGRRARRPLVGVRHALVASSTISARSRYSRNACPNRRSFTTCVMSSPH